MPTKGSGLLYLHKDGFQLYSPLYPTLFEFHFVAEIVKDLDIINADLLGELIKLFITNNKIPPLSLSFVIADNACFIKDFAAPPSAAQPGQLVQPPDVSQAEEAAAKFVDHVPFDHVASKTFPIPNGLRALATNQDLYNAIKEAFVKQEFTVDTVVPGLAFGVNISARPMLDIATAAQLLPRIGSMRTYDLASQTDTHPAKVREEVEVKEENHEEKHEDMHLSSETLPSKPQDKKRLVMLIGVFVILVILLVVVYMNSQTPA